MRTMLQDCNIGAAGDVSDGRAIPNAVFYTVLCAASCNETCRVAAVGTVCTCVAILLRCRLTQAVFEAGCEVLVCR